MGILSSTRLSAANRLRDVTAQAAQVLKDHGWRDEGSKNLDGCATQYGSFINCMHMITPPNSPPNHDTHLLDRHSSGLGLQADGLSGGMRVGRHGPLKGSRVRVQLVPQLVRARADVRTQLLRVRAQLNGGL